ncbi:NFACT family protein [Oscillochloris sp. ZM17-4]|uniref:Rqc2 family fibronectin-binding protein n=1 Tax=Oscillochloris sp. ZM17-4 TaxID=2866714 RepID=UPI001C7334FA|nr:NFACT RNA binding domain-containing protein [Oscillochloris sp. ZM17-4]MBX0329859.1 NFACT family protein [Oscillochloris sp. ZM17-4]
MYFDALTIAAVADELRETILGGRIQRVLQTGPLSIGLEIYSRGQRHQLLASAHPQLARVHLVRARLTRGVEQDTPLLLLMRKYLLGGQVVGVEQPALERILLLSIAKRAETRNKSRWQAAGGGRQVADGGEQMADGDEDLDEELEIFEDDDGVADLSEVDPASSLLPPASYLRCDLIIEPMDRRSNIILVDDNNLVLESVKRVTPRMSHRVIMPRQVYELPPAQEKRDPTRATGEGLAAMAELFSGDLGKAIVASYRGVSPQVAREAIFRALGQPTARMDAALPWYSLAARLRELFTAPWQPSLAAGPGGPAAYAPYLLGHLPDVRPQESVSAALEAFYAAREELTGHTQRRDALAQQLGAARERLARQRDQIGGELRKAGELEALRWEGEMIFAFMHELRPGQAELTVEGRSIALDPRRSPVEQAQERFKAYDKSKSALAGLPERLAAVAARVAGVEELAALLMIGGDDYDQIEQIALEAEELGYLREHPDPATAKRRRKASKARPIQLVSSDGFGIAVGRSARQNEEVTFRIGRPDDIWLHARTIHGAHVIVRSGGREVPEQTLAEAAGLAAHFSQAGGEAAVEIDICRRALVRKVVGGPPGLVTYRAERTLRAAPRRPW